jgi:hypothetical protein
MGISHDQHIPRIFVGMEEQVSDTQDLIEVQTFYALVMSRIADCNIGISPPFAFLIVSASDLVSLVLGRT